MLLPRIFNSKGEGGPDTQQPKTSQWVGELVGSDIYRIQRENPQKQGCLGTMYDNPPKPTFLCRSCRHEVAIDPSEQ